MKGKPTPKYVRDAFGKQVPAKMINPVKLERHVIADALIAEAKQHEERIAKFRDRLWRVVDDYQKWYAKKTKTQVDDEQGATFRTHDNLVWITVKRQSVMRPNDNLDKAKDFAKKTIWRKAKAIGDEGEFIRAVIDKIFKLGRRGNADLATIRKLQEIEWDDRDWRKFRTLINESFDVIDTKRFVQFKWRESVDDDWNTVNLSFAK